MAAPEGRRGAAAAATTATPTSSVSSEAYDAISGYSSFSQMENEVLTRALMVSLFSSSPSRPSTSSSSSSFPDLVLPPELPPSAPPTATSTAADQTEARPGGTAVRASRRRPRGPPARRGTTTYITTNPADFRQMVQQVTGARRVAPDDAVIGTEANPRSRAEPLLAPPPTLDTSAFAMHREREGAR